MKHFEENRHCSDSFLVKAYSSLEFLSFDFHWRVIDQTRSMNQFEPKCSLFAWCDTISLISNRNDQFDDHPIEIEHRMSQQMNKRKNPFGLMIELN